MSKAVSQIRAGILSRRSLADLFVEPAQKTISAPNPDMLQCGLLKLLNGAAHDADQGIQAKIRFARSL